METKVESQEGKAEDSQHDSSQARQEQEAKHELDSPLGYYDGALGGLAARKEGPQHWFSQLS